MFQRKRTLVNHTSYSSTWDDAFLYWALTDHNKRNKYRGLGLWGPRLIPVGQRRFFHYSHFHSLPSCSPPEPQTSPAECQAGERYRRQLWRITAKIRGIAFQNIVYLIKWGLCKLHIFGLWRRTVEILYILGLSKVHTHLHLMLMFESLTLNFWKGNDEM